MYENYWKLTDKPFSGAAHPRFLYYSKKHDEALVRLLYAVSESKGLMLLTGEVGTGKTFLCKLFMRELLEKGYQVAMIVNPDLEPQEFLQQVLAELGQEWRGLSKVELWRALSDFVVENRRLGSETVLIVDEAQMIADRRTLDLLRLLLNLESDGRYLVHLILVGQPEFWQTVRKVHPLHQRIGLSYRLLALSLEETREYIRHRLAVSGATNGIFSDEAIQEVHACSRGIPREINHICDLALLIGCGEEAAQVGKDLVRQAVEDFRGPDYLEQRK